MIQPVITSNELESLNDIDWFDTVCGILMKDKCPLTNQLTQVIGIEDSRFSKENRGSKFLVPFDKRFKFACINPDLSYNDVDKPLNFISFGGIDFKLCMADIIQRFPNYQIHRNTYDGGTQLFFFPIPIQFEFSALSFRFDQDLEDLIERNSLICHQVAFHFGDNVIRYRDGYHMRR